MRTGFIAVPAAILTFFSLMARLDDWHEIHCAIIFDFVVIGPLWAIVAYRSYTRRPKLAVLATVAAYLIPASMLSLTHVAILEARLAALRLGCDYNLRQIGLALRQYETRYGCLPPAYIPDARGKPMHSWRVLLLPFFDQDVICRQYSFNEPWDGPRNRKLLDGLGKGYHCPSEPGDYHNTSYVAVVGPETAWPGARAMPSRDLGGDPHKTILLVEVAASGHPWMEPWDLSFDHMDFHVNGEIGNSISSFHGRSASVLMADGSVQYLDRSWTPEVIRAALTVGKTPANVTAK
jgi:prepilin-type processing-associated H-X9-DG protein